MERFLEEIDGAILNGLFLVALGQTVALPDICGAISYPDAGGAGIRYRKWFDGYVAPRYQFGRPTAMVDGQACWRIRNAILHAGSTEDQNGGYRRIFFSIPNAQGNVFHCNVMNDALNLHLPIFVGDIIAGVRQWLAEDHSDDEGFQARLDSLMTLHPEGLAPYMTGLPLIS